VLITFFKLTKYVFLGPYHYHQHRTPARSREQ
jgi:hypothetical protein